MTVEVFMPSQPPHLLRKPERQTRCGTYSLVQKKSSKTAATERKSTAQEQEEKVQIKKKSSKSVRWTDHCGGLLASSMPFFKFDEPWRCSKTSARPPSPVLLRSASPREACRLEDEFQFELDQLTESYIALDNKIEQCKVALETVSVFSPKVNFLIRLKNLSFEKNVVVRYTTDGWKSSNDLVASYWKSLPNDQDQFRATLCIPNYRLIKSIEFCIGYFAPDNQYWDNADGKNYTISINAQTTVTSVQKSADPYQSYPKTKQQGFCFGL